MPPAVGTITIKLKHDGTAKLSFFGIPTASDVTVLDAVFEKKDKKIIGGFALRTGVIVPSADSSFANEIKAFTIKRQRD